MSYEGYEQIICQNGHYFVRDAHDDGHCMCGAEAAWFNSVDQTNGPAQGAIPYVVLQEKFLLTPQQTETCDHCKHTKITQPDIFRIPTREETEPLRTYPSPTASTTDEDEGYVGGWPT